MYREAIKLLKIIEKNGFKAYIVGGYPRDKYLNIKSSDIDICTSARIEELKRIFTNISNCYIEYGTITVNFNDYDYKITTFRNDKYISSRNDVIINYVSDLKTDLKRRDFTINTLCINSKGEYIDLMGAKAAIDNKKVDLIGKKESLKEDPLRTLRAIRFATILNMTISKKTEKAIYKYGYLIKELSVSKQKYELRKIIDKEYGIDLLNKYNLIPYIKESIYDRKNKKFIKW